MATPRSPTRRSTSPASPASPVGSISVAADSARPRPSGAVAALVLHAAAARTRVVAADGRGGLRRLARLRAVDVVPDAVAALEPGALAVRERGAARLAAGDELDDPIAIVLAASHRVDDLEPEP